MNCDEKRSKKKKNPINVQKYYNGQPCSLPMNSNRIFWERKGGRNRMFMAIVELSPFSNSVYLTTSAYVKVKLGKIKCFSLYTVINKCKVFSCHHLCGFFFTVLFGLVPTKGKQQKCKFNFFFI